MYMNTENLLNIEENSFTIDELLKSYYEYFKAPMAVINQDYEIEGKFYMDTADEIYFDEIKRSSLSMELIRLTNSYFKDGENYKIINLLENKRRCMLLKLSSHNNIWGYLVMLESEKTDFCSIDFSLLEHLSKSIIKILRLKTGEVGFSQLNFWKSLVNHTYSNREIFLSKAMEYKVPLTYNYRVLLLSLDKYNSIEEELLQNTLKSILHNFFLIVKENHVIIILDKELKPDTITLLNNFFEKYQIYAILSSKIIDLYELNVIIKNLIKLFIYLIKLSDEYCLKFEEDNKLLVPLFNAPNDDVILNYINETILDIYLYDETNASSLLETVYQYLLNNKSLDKTGKILFVHKNTVMYRLEKVKDLFSINFDNPMNNFSYIYSIAILKYLISIDCQSLKAIKQSFLDRR